MADAELDNLLTNGFDLEIVEAPVVDADVLVAESEAVELGFRFGAARGGRLRIWKVSMGIQNVQLLKLLDPSEDTVKRSAQEYSQLHVICPSVSLTLVCARQSKTQPSYRQVCS